jgi:ribose 1,5-bisphosphokinase PhnN
MGAAGFGAGAFGCAAATAEVRRHDATTTDRAASCIRPVFSTGRASLRAFRWRAIRLVYGIGGAARLAVAPGLVAIYIAGTTVIADPGRVAAF